MKKQLLTLVALIAVCSLTQLEAEDTYSVKVLGKGMMGLSLGDLPFKPNETAASIDRNGDPVHGTQSLASECLPEGTQCYLYINSAEAIEEARKSGDKIGRFVIENFNRKNRSRYIGTVNTNAEQKQYVYVLPEVMALEQPIDEVTIMPVENEVATMPVKAYGATAPMPVKANVYRSMPFVR